MMILMLRGALVRQAILINEKVIAKSVLFYLAYTVIGRQLIIVDAAKRGEITDIERNHVIHNTLINEYKLLCVLL